MTYTQHAHHAVLTAAIGMLLLGGLSAPGQAPVPGAADKGLLGWWRFDDGGSDTAEDASGNGNDGAIAGAEWVQGEFGTALHFGGTDAQVAVPQVRGLDGSAEMTLATWVYWEGTGRYPNLITGGRWNPGGFLFFVADQTCSFRLGRPGPTPWPIPGRTDGWQEASVPFPRLELGKWYHLAATFKRPAITTYCNGQPVGTGTWDHPVGYSGELLFGTWHSTSGAHQGLMDEVRLYKRALTAEEIKAVYAKEAGGRANAATAAGKPYRALAAEAPPVAPAVVLETRSLRLALDKRARVVALVDKATGQDRRAATSLVDFVTATKASGVCRPTACTYQDGKLTVEFSRSAGTAVLEVTSQRDYLVFKVLAVSDPDVTALTFCNLRLAPMEHVSPMSGLAADDEFGFCLRALNLQTGVTVSGSPLRLSATASVPPGLAGAGAILVAVPAAKVRPMLQEALRREGVLVSPLGGPFALDAPENRDSYLFTTNLSEANVDEWIEVANRAGTPIIHHCAWYRALGHY